MKAKSEEYLLMEEAQMRAFYGSLGISQATTEAAIKIRYNKPFKQSAAATKSKQKQKLKRRA